MQTLLIHAVETLLCLLFWPDSHYLRVFTLHRERWSRRGDACLQPIAPRRTELMNAGTHGVGAVYAHRAIFSPHKCLLAKKAHEYGYGARLCAVVCSATAMIQTDSSDSDRQLVGESDRPEH